VEIRLKSFEMISLRPSTRSSMDDSLTLLCESLGKLKAAKSVDIAEVIERLKIAAESARMVRTVDHDIRNTSGKVGRLLLRYMATCMTESQSPLCLYVALTKVLVGNCATTLPQKLKVWAAPVSISVTTVT
jgi:hypothetical protein